MGNYFSYPTENAWVEERTFGWKRDLADRREHLRVFGINASHQGIKSVDLRDHMPPIYDQGNLNSCTANAICAAYEYDQIKQGEKDPFMPSRLFVYYNEREVEGTVNKDGGAMIIDGMNSINRVGVCHELLWPYEVDKCTVKPTDDCYEEAKKHRSIKYKKVDQTKDQIKQCLIEGYPIVFGFAVYPSFMTPEVRKTGIMPMPKPDEESIGGHAVVLVGIDDEKQAALVRNSWGPNWGLNGYFWMPYKFLLDDNQAADFWLLETVEDDD